MAWRKQMVEDPCSFPPSARHYKYPGSACSAPQLAEAWNGYGRVVGLCIPFEVNPEDLLGRRIDADVEARLGDEPASAPEQGQAF
jgi:hypothetical protein